MQERNETLLISYALSLCAIERLVSRQGYETFDEFTLSYFKLNRARRYKGFCSSLHRMKKRCRVRGLRQIRDNGESVDEGTFSLFFARIDGSPSCFSNVSQNEIIIIISQLYVCIFYSQVTTEPRQDRIARLLCYSADVFTLLREEVILNHYDLAYGNMSPVFMYRKKCKGLLIRKARCYK